MTPDLGVLAEDEHPHEPTGEPGWVEAWLFDVIHDDTLGVSIEFLLWPRQATAAFHASVVRAGLPLVSLSETAIAAPKTSRLEVRASGLWTDIGIQTALEHVTVDIEAFAVALDDPDDVFDGAYGIRTALGCELEWETASHLQRGATATSYEVPCAVHGELLLGDETIEIDGWGWRSHRWGVANLGDRVYQRGRGSDGEWILTPGVATDEPLTLVGRAPVPDVSVAEHGGLHQHLLRNANGDLIWQRTSVLVSGE